MHTGGRHKKCISKGNCMGGWLLPTLPGNSLLSHISSHNIMLKMMINIIMRMVWKLMGDLVIITSLKPTNRLLSPRLWWGGNWHFPCMYTKTKKRSKEVEFLMLRIFRWKSKWARLPVRLFASHHISWTGGREKEWIYVARKAWKH